MQCLVLDPIIMKNRIFILKELGINSVELSHIYRFPTLMRKRVKTFKKINNIPDTRIKYQSFTELMNIIHILKHKFNFDEKFIIKNSYLFNIDVDNVEGMITDFKKIKIKEKTLFDLINIYPRILLYDLNKVKELIDLYRKLDIPYQFSYFFIKCLSMKKKKFLEIYKNFENNTELAVWSKHPRFLQLIYYHKLVKKRLYYMKYLNCLDHANIQIYLSSKEIFLRFIEGEYNLKSKKKLLLYVFHNELGKHINLLSVIQKHPYWKCVPLLMIIKSIQYLKKYYSVEDICQNIHIVLYPRSKIDCTLNLLYKKYSQKEYSAHYLALCLYELEKKYYFSGDGIWPNEVTVFKSNIFEDSYHFDKCIGSINNNYKKNKDTYYLNGKAWLEYLLQ
ncbi:transcription termination factor 5, mitochondrial [Apis mellifera caucasica]|nr:transcription termination factor 5, mitochondrial [Apis mellifera caucasica]KAG9428674.1 transcription termination factor 5, mitochondrial [Apis mellifera carnica]